MKSADETVKQFWEEERERERERERGGGGERYVN